jgi:hypothetical protein
MVTKRDLEVAIAAYGLGRILPAGSTRAAVTAAVKGVVRGGRLLARPTASTVARTGLGVGRTIAGLSPQGRLILGGLTLAEAYDRGLLDAPIERSQEVFADTIAEGIERTRPIMPDTVPEGFQGFRRPKKKPTKHNRAVKAGMAAVKKSKFGGKKGTISNAKTTFGTVNKTISMLKKGRKAPKSGIKGTIAKSVKRFI